MCICWWRQEDGNFEATKKEIKLTFCDHVKLQTKRFEVQIFFEKYFKVYLLYISRV